MNLLLRFPHLALPRIKAKERSNPTLSSPRCQQDSKNKLEKMLVTQESARVFDPTPVSLFPWRDVRWGESGDRCPRGKVQDRGRGRRGMPGGQEHRHREPWSCVLEILASCPGSPGAPCLEKE